MKDDEFVNLELHAWTVFLDVGKNILSNLRTENYEELLEKLLKHQQSYNNMSIKVHFFS